MTTKGTVLVTGGTGFIGRHVIAPLAQRGYDVHGVTFPDIAIPMPAGARMHVCNLLDAAERRQLVAAIRPTHLLHLAWYVKPGAFWSAPENLDWIAASLALLQDFVAIGGRRAVIAGTCAEYDWSYPLCIEDKTPLLPATLYGVSKDALHRVAKAFLKQKDCALAWGRVFLLYGPDEPESRLVPSVARALLRGEPARCTEGRQIRDFMHVADVAGAFAALLDSAVEGPVNIATGTAVPIRDVVQRIGDLLEGQHLLRLGALPTAANDPPELRADATRLLKEVGFQPAHTLEAGLRETVDWWRERERR